MDNVNISGTTPTTWINAYINGVDWTSGNGAVVAKADVEEAALELLDKNGWVTTLHIKTFLRNKGFWVSQKEVSVYMAELASDRDDIGWTQTDKFRTYNKKTAPVRGTLSTGVVVDDKSFAVTKKTYEVTGPFGADKHTFVVDSRGQAKWKWAKETGRSFFMARAKRIF